MKHKEVIGVKSANRLQYVRCYTVMRLNVANYVHKCTLASV